MKLFLVLIIVSLISIINGAQYINFQPFSASGCKGQSAGIGYSILVNECISYDQNTTFIFESNNKNQIKWSKFSKYTGDNDCQNTPISQGTFKNNACIKNNNIAFDSASLPVTNGFYKTSITNEPVILDNTYVKQYMVEDCTSSNVVMLDYFTNGTKAVYNSTGVPYSYFCSQQNKPYTYTCSIWGCFPSITATNCQSVSPFSNSSSEYYYSVYCNTN
ncbi:hypothetical protein DICPUDRAFT_87385 [Dictyostelium purpureum]|uniref:Uncharacterized protein n=1 Tax=Dictyostelium purpureum TaxID=5786 RepID=F0ZHS7_DICPU|nr:uncharacterized protein DICPUDRAFT_87385 [Dictyostelium purpureum]EGC36527.1 hypothetical protein DICPUDRAFT_87385 [Dictyostelium purpureum]|eukprot:XP_003286972.1 hypothetical protein DICPUDRAFT_87385 [Dictyostelium purpureum]